MRSNGLATVLLMIPVLTVPALAIFGIPQFAPVVASPLDEGEEFDRGPRSGNSSRQSSREEMFSDIDEIASDTEMRDEPLPRKRKSSLASNSSRSLRRSKDKDQEAPTWNDDLNNDWSSKRRQPATDRDELSDADAESGSRKPRKTAALDKTSRDKSRSASTVKNQDVIRLASASDSDRGMNSMGFDDGSFDNSRPAVAEERSRAPEPRRTQRRTGGAEPVTWAVAVERLNELDIRNFRLEPGRQQGQFMFICVYTPPDNPSVMHRFEAEAEQPLKAVENVLDQIVEWQQRR